MKKIYWVVHKKIKFKLLWNNKKLNLNKLLCNVIVFQTNNN